MEKKALSTHDLEKLAEKLGATDPACDRTSATAIRLRVRHPIRADAQEHLAKRMAKETGLHVEVIER